MKIVVSCIDWDYPGKEEGAECPLPTEVNIEVEPESSLLEDIHGEALTLVEHLTAMYGCCICGLCADVEEVDGNG